ncbi:BON domain-containing protein [Fulvimonas yonginensis]|uniref:BON domain-containing protein n=1 Tax=Fulvimonas yonginensis TaxID=1495200 RepID=A0ABU8J710_9GAMM
MSTRYDDDYSPRNRQRMAEERDERRDPYESQRQVRTYGDDNRFAAEHPWQAAHPRRWQEGGQQQPRWNEEPSRYGGGYRGDELWSSQQQRPLGDARYDLDTRAERNFVEGYQNDDNRHRAHGYGASYGAWRGQRDYGRGYPGQSNSGYDAERAYGQGRYQDDARSNAAHGSWTQEHDYEGPRYGGRPYAPGGYGSQQGRADTYGGAGFRQEGKRYWFDEGDQRNQFRGTRPRGYERSDERLRELVCERLTDADIDASDIEVKVNQGVVTLEGSVRARWMKHQAEDIVDDCGGVKDIQNRLRVGTGTSANANVQGTTAAPAPGTTATGTTGTSTASASMGGSTTGGSNPGDLGGRSKH